MLAALVACAVVAVAVPLAAAEPVSQIDGPADVGAPAQRISRSGDLVSVSQSSAMSASIIASAHSAAAAAGAQSVGSSGYSVGLTWVRRGDVVMQDAAAGPGLWQFPMGVSVLPVEALTALMGSDVQTAVANGMVAMSETAAAMRNGARAGDTIGLVAASGEIVTDTIGFVAPDAYVGGTDIVMSPAMAARLGVDEVTRVLIYGSFSRNALDAALASRGLVDGTAVRVVRSWDARSPDSILGSVRTKQLLGEFAYQLTATGVEIDPAWVASRLPATRETYASIGVRARCHVVIRNDLQAALTEVYESGLAGAIDLGDTNVYGGCYNPRFNRLTGNLGFLSRHAWAQAIDMNPSTNAQGARPQMDCRIVRIFRKHGFAWGGNFLTPDGMHFEWVGEPRHTLQYPSEYCPNVATGGTQSLVEPPTQRDVMFANDGWLPSDDHP